MAQNPCLPAPQKRVLKTAFVLACFVTGSVPALAKEQSHKSKPQAAKTYACGETRMTESQIAAHRGISLQTLNLLRTHLGLTPEEICTIPSGKLSQAIFKAQHPKPDHPGEALAFRRLQMQDENGYIPPDGHSRAMRHVEMMKGAQAENLSPAAGITRSGWTWIGPGNIGGRVRSIVIHPTTPSTMWLGSVSGGIWKTTDSGTTWNVVDDFMTDLAVSTLVMNPTSTSIMYAGTGEGFYNSDGIRGEGIFKSSDGGTTWTQLSSTANSNFYYVNRLAISPAGSTVLAAARTGIWRSIDAGLTWTQAQTTETLDINFNPSTSNAAIASGYGKAWYSTNGGSTWTAATGIPTGSFTRVEVAYAPNTPTTVYASVDVNSGEVWKSTDGGQSFSRVNTGNNYLATQGWYDNIVWVDPTNPNTLIVGGVDLWRSTDGGTTLTKISQWFSAPNSAHADHHYVIEHPSFDGLNNTKAYFGNDGGIYRADNVYTVSLTSGWQELNNNLGITQFYGAAGNSTTNVIVGGTQDNGTLRYIGGTETWTTMFGGDGGWCAADPTDSNYFYGEYVYLKIHRSTDAGVSSNYIYTGITDATNSTANFISPFILDPNNNNTLLGGGLSLWRSNNVKASTPIWASIKSSIGSNISAIAVALSNSNIIWVGHNNGDVYETTNGTSTTPTWTRMDLNTPNLPNRMVTRITIDPNNSNIVYVTFGGFSADNVWRTNDGGMTWNDATGTGSTGLPDVPVRSLVIHPNNSSWLYVGTQVGIFASENSGTTWSVPHDGPANVSVDELFWMNTKLVAATHGRGLFTAGTSCSISLSSTSQSVVASGRTGSVTVTAGTGCAWTVTSSATWLSITSATSGSGNGTVSYSVSANKTSSSRTGTLTIGGKTFTVTQDGTSGTIFSDVSLGYWAYDYIVAIYKASITNGCGDGKYCPTDTVTREQMAAFIIRAVEGERSSSYCSTGSPFVDVTSDNVFCGDIKRLSELAITTVTTNFKPKDLVTRGQMAAFIIRAKYGEIFTYTSTPYFSDVPATHGFFKYVQKMKDTSITAVTGTYSVDSNVTRAEMAAFLSRAFLGLP